MQRAMWRYYAPGATERSARRINDRASSLDQITSEVRRLGTMVRFGNVHPLLPHTECADAEGQPAPPPSEMASGDGAQLDLLDFDLFLDELERRCGAEARVIAMNLVSPYGRCAVGIIEQIEEKRRGRARGRDLRGVSRTIRVSMRMVREAMGMDQTAWRRAIAAIREFAALWYDRAPRRY